MSWQSCPVCYGTGLTYIYTPVAGNNYYQLNSSSQVCTVCSGTKIINTKTGLPPKSKSELKRLTISGAVRDKK